jgi:hypothetical protein
MRVRQIDTFLIARYPFGDKEKCGEEQNVQKSGRMTAQGCMNRDIELMPEVESNPHRPWAPAEF